MELQIPLRSNPGVYKLLGEPRLVNAYVESTGEDNKAPYALIPCAGLAPLGADKDGACRGMIWLEEDSKLYAVFGFRVYDVAADGTKTEVGLIGGTQTVYIARNDAAATQVVIVTDNGVTFVLEGGSLTLTKYVDSDGNTLFTPVGVTQCGGYFIYWETNGKFWVSALNATTVDALSFATAESDPDGLTKAHGRGNVLYLIGTQSVEVWAVTGDSDFPIKRVQGAHLRFGSQSPHSIVDFDQGIMMVASDNTVRFVQGYQNEVVSNREVARLIEAETDKGAIYAFAHTRGENKFYTLQGSNWTREFNSATGSWHDRYSGVSDQWKAAFYARAHDKHIFGSRQTGRTFEGTYETYTEDGEPLIWGFDTQIFHAFPDGLEFERIDLDMETGQGPSVAEEGEVMLSWSDDNYRSWRGERRLGMGKLGEYQTRVRANNLGQCREKGRAFRVRISDPIIRAINMIDAKANKVEL